MNAEQKEAFEAGQQWFRDHLAEGRKNKMRIYAVLCEAEGIASDLVGRKLADYAYEGANAAAQAATKCL